MVNTGKPSQAAIGRALGLSPAAMTKLKKQGMPVDCVERAQAWRVDRQNVAARKPLPSGPPPAARRRAAGSTAAPPPESPAPYFEFPGEDHQAARTRREISEANMAEMREAEERRDLIRVDAVRSSFASLFSSTRDSLMQIPARLSPVLAAEVDPARVHDLLAAEILQSLQQLVAVPARLTARQGDPL